jgi:three-Cys-motif partner protein
LPQRFGGSHTEQKLDKLEAYLKAFTTALKHQPFRLFYFDAFAGTPDINLGTTNLPLLRAENVREFIDGSSRRALKFGASFERYIFVEKSKAKVKELQSLKTEYPDLADRMDIQHSEANEELERFCKRFMKMQRAVIFLDPFGNQVRWDTVERIAATRAVDLWYLFPAGLGVHRQIGRDGSVHFTHEDSLDRIFGTSEWRTAFTSSRDTDDLFGQNTERAKIGTPESITRFMIDRMKQIFAGGVLDEWLPLGSDGRHSYSLIFACANPEPKASSLALKLARAVLRSEKRGRS